MAGSIRTRPVTREYEEGFERLSEEPAPEPEREVRPHDCERCGKHMEYADQACGCGAKDAWLGR